MLDLVLAKAHELERRGVFLGGPMQKFVSAGRGQLEILLRHGLTPDDRVLDVGCGALRGGWWVINFLRPGRYFGIEPNTAMLCAGTEVMLGSELFEEKRPQFSHNAEFDFSVFATIFEFAIARSIWTHASAAHIRRMLQSFVRCSHPRSVFLASFLAPKRIQPEYSGKDWTGRSHTADTPGIARYRFETLEGLCNAEGLKADLLGKAQDQYWVRVSHPKT